MRRHHIVHRTLLLEDSILLHTLLLLHQRHLLIRVRAYHVRAWWCYLVHLHVCEVVVLSLSGTGGELRRDYCDGLHSNAGRLRLSDGRIVFCRPHRLSLGYLTARVIFIASPLLLAHPELLLLLVHLRLLLIESRVEC